MRGEIPLSSYRGSEFMKALLEVEITGDFEDPLSNDSIIDILNAVIVDGADSVALEGEYRIIKVYRED